MKRVLAVAAAGLAAVAIYATVAPAGQQAVTPRQFAALSSKVNTLSKKLNALTREVAAFEGCVRALGVAEYGDPNGNFGYLYDTSTGSSIYTTALDVVPSGQTPPAWALITPDSQCASAFNSAKAKVDLRPSASK